MYRPTYTMANVPKSLKEIESLDIEEEDEDDVTSVYSMKSHQSLRSNISEITLPNSFQNPSLVRNQVSIQSIQEEMEEDDEYEELTEENPDFMLFKEEVKQWLMLDDDIRVLNKAMTERKKKKNEITPKIIEFMSKYEIENLNTQEGKLQCTKTMVTKPMNREYMRNRLSEFMRNVEKAEKCTEYIFKNREKEEKVRLRRILN